MRCVKCFWFLNTDKCKKQSSQIKDCEDYKKREYKLDEVDNGFYKFSKLEVEDGNKGL